MHTTGRPELAAITLAAVVCRGVGRSCSPVPQQSEAHGKTGTAPSRCRQAGCYIPDTALAPAVLRRPTHNVLSSPLQRVADQHSGVGLLVAPNRPVGVAHEGSGEHTCRQPTNTHTRQLSACTFGGTHWQWQSLILPHHLPPPAPAPPPTHPRFGRSERRGVRAERQPWQQQRRHLHQWQGAGSQW